MPLEARPDRPSERVRLGMALGALRERVEPAGRHQHVVVDEGDQVGLRLAQPRVARGVQLAPLAVPDQPHAEALSDLGRGVRGPVVDDEDLVRHVAALAAAANRA